MNRMGRRLYYDKESGLVFFEIPEQRYDYEIVPQTIERDIEVFKLLSERHRDTFDVLEFEYGQYAQDFRESNGYRVNPKTKQLEFSYPDPVEPESSEPIYQAPLSEEVSTLKATNEDLSNYVLEMDMRLVMVEMGI